MSSTCPDCGYPHLGKNGAQVLMDEYPVPQLRHALRYAQDENALMDPPQVGLFRDTLRAAAAEIERLRNLKGQEEKK